MNLQEIDTVICNYVGEKNRERIEDDAKRPMFSSPISPWRSAENVDDIRTDMINKISLTLIGGPILFYSLKESVSLVDMIAIGVSTGVIVGVYQLSRMYNNAVWKILGKSDGGVVVRSMMGGTIVLQGIGNFLILQSDQIRPIEMIPLLQFILSSYIQFHLIYTRDTLPKKPEEKITQKIGVFQGT